MSIDCQPTASLLLQEADGDLSPEQRDRFDAHVRTCAACRDQRERFLAVERQVADFGDLAGRGLLPPVSPPKPSILRWLPATAAAVAATVLLAVALTPRLPQPPATQPPVAASPVDGFVPIPYVPELAPYETARIIHAEVPVAALTAAGYRIPLADPAATVQADLLVGEDGRTHAIRVASQIAPTEK